MHPSTRGRWTRVVAVVATWALAASGCTVSELARTKESSTRLAQRCSPERVLGEFAPAAAPGQVQISLRGETTCDVPTREVIVVSRVKRLDTGAQLAVALGVGGLVAASLVAGVAALGQTSPAWRSPGEAELVTHVVGWGGLGLGTLLGMIPAVLIMAPTTPRTEVTEHAGEPEVRSRPVAGSLASSSGDRHWPVDDGGVTLELATLDGSDLETASAHGVAVTWSDAAARGLGSLTACRLALADWDPAAPADCRRLDPALRCAEGGWRLAAPVEAALAASCARAATADAGAPLVLTPPLRASPPSLLPGPAGL